MKALPVRKTCPFCGTKPFVGPQGRLDEVGDAWGFVECRAKRCPTYESADGRGLRITDGERAADERGRREYQRAAINRWNRRR